MRFARVMASGVDCDRCEIPQPATRWVQCWYGCWHRQCFLHAFYTFLDALQEGRDGMPTQNLN